MKQRIIYGLLAGLFMWLYWLTWPGAMLFMFIIAACLFAYLVSEFYHRKAGYLGIAGVIVVGVITGLIFFYKILPSAFKGATAITTMELEPLTIFSAMQNFGLIAFLLPVILGFLIYQAAKRGAAPLIILVVWSLIMLVAVLTYRRYAYYFAINASLLSGWFIWYLWNRLSKKDMLKAVVTVALLCMIVVIPNIQQATAKQTYPVPSDAWHETLAWVKDNTPEDSLILAWWDYGHWIERMADREPYVNPGQRKEEVANTACMFTSPSEEGGVEADYIILDYHTVIGKFWAVATWAGREPSEFYSPGVLEQPMWIYHPQYYQSLAVRLYNFNGKAVVPIKNDLVGWSPFISPVPLEAVEGYTLVYESRQKVKGVAEVKVFRRE